MIKRARAALLAAMALTVTFGPHARADAPPSLSPVQQAGARIFQERCASCHDQPGNKAPSRAVLSQISVEDVAKALILGPMAAQAQGLTIQQVGAVATYVSHKATRPDPSPTANMCAPSVKPGLAGPSWNGWGNDQANTRFQPTPGFSAADVGRLTLKWAFSYPGQMVYGQPTIVGGRLFVTSLTGRVQALDAATGCTLWTYESGAPSRTAITVATGAGANATPIAYFGGEDAVVHAVNADTGVMVWKAKVDTHRAARVTGAPVLHGGRLYVPVASSEEFGASAPYQCCTFRGSVVALDAATGHQIWKTYTIPQPARPYARAKDGTTLLGPAGASIWSAPTIDAPRGRLYVGTSNSYSGAPTNSSDAIMAFSLKDGSLLWSSQFSTDDNFVMGCYVQKPPVCKFGICNGPGEGECPDKVGPDHDFGASPILRVLPNGHRVLLAGQKSAFIYGLDPDHDGKLLWKLKAGIGGPAGGVEWGMAADPQTLFAPSSDIYMGPPDAAGGLTAIDIATGKSIWHVPAHPTCAWGPENCWGGVSQAVTAMPGVVFAGAIDGHLRAYRAEDGKQVWDFDAGGTFKTVNQGEQSGGSLNLGGPTLAGGLLFVNAGYGRFVGQNGHVLLAFAVGR
ncbi:MAG: PQQ-binding-like beta-propeller repeat protein [Rhodospirillales bacterium]